MRRFNPAFQANASRKFSRPRSRMGCLGCLPRALLGLALGCLLVLVITAVFAPWGFFLGGKFHIIPYW